MTFLHVYCTQEPGASIALLDRFGPESIANTGESTVYVLDTADPDRDVKVIAGLGLGQYEHHPRLIGERHAEEPHKLFPASIADLVKNNEGRITANEDMFALAEDTGVFHDTPIGYERIFGLLHRTQGAPIYRVLVSPETEHGMPNALHVAEVLAKRLDGYVWNPEANAFTDEARRNVPRGFGLRLVV